MSKAQSDIRPTSYDAATAKPEGYQGTIEDVLAQIRAEEEIPPPTITARQELLGFLGVSRPVSTMSGYAVPPHKVTVTKAELQRMARELTQEDWSVQYGKPTAHSPYSLAHAKARWPENFK